MFNQWSERTKAAMGESSGVTGGYIVPPDFYYGLLQIAAEEATFRARAFVQPMAGQVDGEGRWGHRRVVSARPRAGRLPCGHLLLGNRDH
jgi:hypothetical protein